MIRNDIKAFGGGVSTRNLARRGWWKTPYLLFFSILCGSFSMPLLSSGFLILGIVLLVMPPLTFVPYLTNATMGMDENQMRAWYAYSELPDEVKREVPLNRDFIMKDFAQMSHDNQNELIREIKALHKNYNSKVMAEKNNNFAGEDTLKEIRALGEVYQRDAEISLEVYHDMKGLQ